MNSITRFALETSAEQDRGREALTCPDIADTRDP